MHPLGRNQEAEQNQAGASELSRVGARGQSTTQNLLEALWH